MSDVWRVDTPRQTLVFVSKDGGLPEVAYWGAPLPEGEDLSALTAALLPEEVTGGMLDARPKMTVCPLPKDLFPGHLGATLASSPALRMIGQPGDVTVFEGGEYRYTLTAEADQSSGVIALTARLQGDGIRWLAAPGLPGPATGTHFRSYAGKWTGEFARQDIPWTVGAHTREVRDGRTSHEAFPGIMMGNGPILNTRGEVFALHLGQSAGHRMVAEELPDGRRQVLFGPMLHNDGADDVTAGPIYLGRSDTGVNGITESYHAHLRSIVDFPDPARPRPVHYNCWEAVYFRHDQTELQAIATRAAQLGAERFVLDDGWFKGRNDDTTSLGDWEVDRDKFPDGLTPLIDAVHSDGLTFGLWVEPEMVNPESDLHRAHPDWVLGWVGQPLARQQLVLDIAKPEVSAYLFACLDAILSEYDIDYLKWDHNRVLPSPDHRQAEAIYALLDRLRTAHPSVEIESCASGGGRIDWGILARTHRVWLSDSNDALERMRMQSEALPFLIPEVTGSHVGPRECHTSGRILPIALRGWIAAQRHFGFEMDPRELTDAEAVTLTNIATWWKETRHWLMPAARYLLDLDDPERFGEIAVAQDQSKFVLWLGQRGTPSNIMPRPVPLTGLDPNARYHVRLLNADDVPAMWSRNDNPFKTKGITLSGAALMGRGIIPPVTLPASIYVFQGERVA